MGSFRQFLKKCPGVLPVLRLLQRERLGRDALQALREERSILRQGPVKVGFVVQFLPAWSKLEPIYRAMQADPGFEPVLLCLPSGIQANRLLMPESMENDTYFYLKENGFSEAVNTLVGKEQWLDPKSLGLEYLFYQRPYNTYLPPVYTVSCTSRHSKVCLLMYAIEMLEEITDITLDRDFMAYVSWYFAENTAVADINIRRNRRGHKLGLQHTVCLGMPVLENLLRKRQEKSPAWDFSRNSFRAIWTPRWTTDKSAGGSNFFTYYQVLTQYAAQHPDMDFLYRPHPMTFDNFVRTGEMTPQQVQDFKARCESLPNVQLDIQQQYDATFWGSTVLISDYSGMVPEYFLTGKPLIFCMTNMELTLSDFGKKILEGCYVVESAQELFFHLERLKAGEDPLRERRQQLIQMLYGENEGVCGRILQAIAR